MQAMFSAIRESQKQLWQFKVAAWVLTAGLFFPYYVDGLKYSSHSKYTRFDFSSISKVMNSVA